MSIGTSSLNITVNGPYKSMALSGGPIWFRNLVSMTISGTTATPANMVMMVYRGSEIVALAQAFTGPDGAVIGDFDTNTSEMEVVFDGISLGACREFDIFLYDSSIPELLAVGTFDVWASRDYAGTSPIPPISSTTLFIGSFAFYNGKTYIRSIEDGLYYEFSANGSGGTVTETLNTTGITIPGSP